MLVCIEWNTSVKHFCTILFFKKDLQHLKRIKINYRILHRFWMRSVRNRAFPKNFVCPRKSYCHRYKKNCELNKNNTYILCVFSYVKTCSLPKSLIFFVYCFCCNSVIFVGKQIFWGTLWLELWSPEDRLEQNIIAPFFQIHKIKILIILFRETIGSNVFNWRFWLEYCRL